jgi:hypothetical protein
MSARSRGARVHLGRGLRRPGRRWLVGVLTATAVLFGGGAAPVGATVRVAQGGEQNSPASATGLTVQGRKVAMESQALPSVSYGVACGDRSCQYANSLSDVYPAPLTWSTTPSLFGVPTGGNVGWGSAELQTGIVTVGAITDGVADQGVEDWLQAVYNAPNPTGTASAWDSLSVHAHIYTVVLSNNFGLFSNVSASFLNFILQAEGVQDEQQVSVNTGVTVGPPDFEDMQTLEQALDFASSQMQNAATSAISVAAGQADPESAFSNYISSAFGEAVYQTDLTLSVSAYVSGQGPQPVDIQLSPELGVANAGLGITGTYVVSQVQLTVSGTAQPAGTPTSLSLELHGPGGQALPADSRGLPEASFGQPLELEANLHAASGEVIGLSGPKVSFAVPTVDAGGPLSCTLRDGTCTATLPVSTPMPVGLQPVTARWAGTGGDGYAGSATSKLVDVAPGQSQLRLVPLWPGGTDVMAGQPYTVRVFVSGATGMNFLPLGTGGTVTLFDDGSPAGTCTPAELPETSGDGCDITWAPGLGPDVPTRSVKLEATWTGNRVYRGTAGETATSFTVAHPGVGVFLMAEPPALGYSWAVVCTTNKFGATVCKPKVTLRTSGTVTAEVLSNGSPMQGASVQLSSEGPGSLSASACTTGEDGSCAVEVKVPASKSTVLTQLVATTADVAAQAGPWQRDLELLDVGSYGAQAPSVSAVSPNSGPVAGGNAVQVSGSDLWGASKVTFGGVPAPAFSVQGDGSLTVVAPRGEGTCNVQVTTALGTSAPNAADRYSFGSAPAPAQGGGATVVLPGDLDGLIGGPSGGAWASLWPPRTSGAPVSGGSVVLLSARGALGRHYPAPYTTGWMALYGGDLYYLARTGSNYTNWQTTLVRLSTSTGTSNRFSYTAAPVGPGGVVVGSGSAPVYVGASEIGGPYGLPAVLELSPSTGKWAARSVPSPQGGGVGGLASGPSGGIWGIVPKSSEVFWLSSPGARFRTFIAPGTTEPVSLNSIAAVGTTAYAAVAGAAPGAVGIYAVDSANGRTAWLPAPGYVASVSGSTWDDGLWVGAVTSKGEAGVLGYRAGVSYRAGTWSFVPVYAHASYTARLLLAPAGPGELWFGQAGGDRLWRLKVVPAASGPVPLASGRALPKKVPVRKSNK